MKLKNMLSYKKIKIKRLYTYTVIYYKKCCLVVYDVSQSMFLYWFEIIMSVSILIKLNRSSCLYQCQ